MEERVPNKGRKIFFIGLPDNFLPDDMLAVFLEYGYETYRLIYNGLETELVARLSLILNLYENSIFFFYVDAHLYSLGWNVIIQGILKDYADKVSIGIVYNDRLNAEENKKLEHAYKGLGLENSTFLSMNHNKQGNFNKILATLQQSDARGNRSVVRAVCNGRSTCQLAMSLNKYEQGEIKDISVSHFSCMFQQPTFKLPPYPPVRRVQVQLYGLLFEAGCKCLTTRETSAGMLYVFAFFRHDGKPGLADDTRWKLLKKIYQILSDQLENYLQSVFYIMRKYKSQFPDDFTTVSKTLAELRGEPIDAKE